MSIGSGRRALEVCSGGIRAGGMKGLFSWLTLASDGYPGTDNELVGSFIATKAI